MTQLAPAAVVRYPQLVPPTVSLLSAAQAGEEVDERWYAGIKFVTDGCGDEFETFSICDTYTLEASSASPALSGTPYGIVAQDTCTAFSKDARDFQARATRKLLALESFVIARELWDGHWVGENPTLADPIDTVATASDLAHAIGNIETAFWAESPGQRATIHVSSRVLNLLINHVDSPAVRREGNVYITPMDSIVAVDRGYPGTGPSAQAISTSQEWIYATAPIVVRRGPIIVTPSTIREATKRDENQITFRAERIVHAGWDYNCPTIAMNVTGLNT